MADAARHLRAVLNVSLTTRTRTAQQIHSAGEAGGGVHHIALASKDIFTTADRLRANGVCFVPISGNYYDDLAARLALDDAQVARMRALDIVFDHTGGGRSPLIIGGILARACCRSPTCSPSASAACRWRS